MIPADILARLPDQARSKLLLLDGLAADALDASDAAQGRLNNLGRQYPAVVDANPNVARLAAIVEVQTHRHQELFNLVNACQRWVRALPPQAELEVVAIDPPPQLDGETIESVEEAVTRIRAKLAELVVERLEVSRAPEPKSVIKQPLREQMRQLAAHAAPTLRLERGKAEAAIFRDQVPDVSIHEAYLVGPIAWLDPERMDEARLNVERESDRLRCHPLHTASR